jgi:hypothetical protein
LAGNPGNGEGSGYGSADGTGGSASFTGPLGIAVGPDGNLFVTDQANKTVRKITPEGVVTTFAGSVDNYGEAADGTGPAARFTSALDGIAVDKDGNVYVADYCAIRKITPAGVVTTFAGSILSSGYVDGTGTDARFRGPSGLAVDNAGNIYVADAYTVRKITPDAVVTTLAGADESSGFADGIGGAAQFNRVLGVAVDSDGNVFVTDGTPSNSIRKVTSEGVVTTIAGIGDNSSPPVSSGSADGTGDVARFNFAEGIAVDAEGNLYVADSDNNTIRKGSRATVPADLDGDGHSDLLWSNSVTGERVVWLMDGTSFVDSAYLGVVSTDWSIDGTGDFDGDRKADILWTNSASGERAIWLMNRGTITDSANLGVVPTDWSADGIDDFNGDGKADILWTNSASGERVVWLMNGTAITDSANLGVVPTDWSVSGTGDLDGDGKADIVWTNTTTGERAVWLMDGASLSSSTSFGAVPAVWSISGVGDFDGDGNADILWTNTSTGDRAMWLMDGGAIKSGLYVAAVPVAWSVSCVADFDGDGKSDIAWTNTTTGERAMWLMKGSTISESAWLGVLPLKWSIDN